MADEHKGGEIQREQTIQQQRIENGEQYYKERYENIRPSLPETRVGMLLTGTFILGTIAIISQYYVPPGTPPNSIEPWVGPVPFSWAYFFFWMVVLQATMVAAYFKLTNGGGD